MIGSRAKRACLDAMSPTTPRLLLLTASFGDGHNSAARGLAAALHEHLGTTCRVEVRDLIRDTQPIIGRLLEMAYASTITHAPWAWRQFYRRAGRLPLENDPMLALQPLRDALAHDLQRHPPAAIACTFPLYPHLLHRLLGRSRIPVHTVVTDSITIHPVWRCDSVRTYFAADEISADRLRAWRQPDTAVVDVGFPVAPDYARLPAAPASDTLRSALYFPAGSTRTLARALHSLVHQGPPNLEITVVLGRHARRLGPLAREIAATVPQRRIRILGWVDHVPSLMTTHDIVIAKAGGATTHETAAAGRPSVIVKVVPGQEEGNVELIERRGSGLLENNPDALGPLLHHLATSGKWQRLRDAAWKHRRPDGARRIARAIIQQSPAISPIC